MTIKLLLLIASVLCLLVAMVMGFGEGWLGIDSSEDYGGWLALGLAFLVGSHLSPR